MRKLRAYGSALIVAGILLIVISTILPQIKSQQTLTRKGPTVKLDTINYWIDTFILPPIDEGSQFFLNLQAEKPGNESITIMPYRNGEIVGDVALISKSLERSESSFMVSTVVKITASYFVSVVSIKNNYTLTIRSTWSPYDSLRVYVYWGLAALPAGLLILYYDRIKEKQDRQYKEAVPSTRPR